MNKEKSFEIVCLGEKNDMSIEDIENWINDVLAIKDGYAVSSGVWEYRGKLYISLTKTEKSYNRFELVKETAEAKR